LAGDWIKMRMDLWDHPKVVRIVSAICPQGVRDVSLKCRVIGALYRTWAIADTHSEDGILDGYDAESLNASIGIDGWAENMQHVGWLVVESQRLIVPRFTEHNGESAKKRAEDAKRKRLVRKTSAKRPQRVRKSADKKRTREEKRRVTTPIPPSGAFLRFWGTWPKSNRKQAQGQCWDRWRKADMDLCADAIIAHVEGLKGSADWRKNGGEFVPAPLVYLNQRRWEGAEAPAAVQEAPLYRREGVM
jgi:hypothetical protein